ncbi:hypothetical protein HKD37_11G030122 [Glycine soja]
MRCPNTIHPQTLILFKANKQINIPISKTPFRNELLQPAATTASRSSTAARLSAGGVRKGRLSTARIPAAGIPTAGISAATRLSSAALPAAGVSSALRSSIRSASAPSTKFNRPWLFGRLCQVKESVILDGTISGVSEILNEAELLRSALGSSLPTSWSLEADISYIGYNVGIRNAVMGRGILFLLRQGNDVKLERRAQY